MTIRYPMPDLSALAADQVALNYRKADITPRQRAMPLASSRRH